MSSLNNQLDIDFLPARYREQHVRRRLNVWRLAVVVAVGALVALGAVHQWTVRWALERELAEVQARYEAQKESILQVNTLEDGLLEAESQARLVAYLSHPWPRTQVLAAVLQPIPAEMRLLDFKIAREAIEKKKPTNEPAPVIDPSTPVEKPAGETADLEQLKKECDDTEIVVLIEGIVSSPGALQTYLSEVSKSPLIGAAELQSLTADEFGGTRFRVRIEIVPGIGQPGGPETTREARAPREEAVQ